MAVSFALFPEVVTWTVLVFAEVVCTAAVVTAGTADVVSLFFLSVVTFVVLAAAVAFGDVVVRAVVISAGDVFSVIVSVADTIPEPLKLLSDFLTFAAICQTPMPAMAAAHIPDTA